MSDLELLNPKEMIANAGSIANVCKAIVLSTSVQIQSKKHVQVEGWQALAVANNCVLSASDAKREYDSQGNHIGYSAKGFVKDKLTGIVISEGEGFVGFDEFDKKGNPTWKHRAEYAGRAMAQTRAMSRAGRSAYSFIVTLMGEGLSTTPAEEVPADGFEKELNTHNNELPEIGTEATKEDKDLYFKSKKDFLAKFPGLELCKSETGNYVFQPFGTYATNKK